MSRPGVNTRTGNTTEPTPLFGTVNEVKVGEARMAPGFVATVVVPVSFVDAIVNVPAFCLAPRVKPVSVNVCDAVVDAAPVILRMS